jgi:hypothetical protein
MDSSQAIKITSLQRMLEYYGPRQVSLIGDACQEFSAKFIDIVGSAVLHKTGEKQRFFELDQFFAVDVGKQAFMIKAKGDKKDFCLFTEVLLDALEGDAQGDYFDTEGADKVVTSHSLARYLKVTVAKEAGKYGVQMNPYPRPGFFTDTTYLRIPGSIMPDLSNWLPHLSGNRKTSGPDNPDGLELFKQLVKYGWGLLKKLVIPKHSGRSVKRIELIKPKSGRVSFQAEPNVQKSTPEAWLNDFAAQVSKASENTPFDLSRGIAISGAEVTNIQASFGSVFSVGEQRNLFQVNWEKSISDSLAWCDTLVTLTDGRIVPVCVVNGVFAVLHIIDATSLALFHRVESYPNYEDSTSIDLLALLHDGAGFKSPDYALEWATNRIRDGEHRNLMLGCITAQFYDVIRDVVSLRSMAEIYAILNEPVPLDIILYCGGTIREHDGHLFADIPDWRVREEKQDEIPVFKDYPIAGRVPWMRQAWGAVATARCDASAEAWREQALTAMEHLAPGLFTVAKPSGHAAFFKLAGIRDIQDNAEHTRTR